MTGLVDPNEPIENAVVRELFEETGVKGTFKRILAVRQGRGTLKKGDLFFVCLVEPHSEDIIIQQNEIEKACWMDMDQFFPAGMDGVKASLQGHNHGNSRLP